jgi:putative ABC transport system permease protein
LFYVRYIVSELRRRRGRTLLTALGLAVGVGLVVTVTALSNGLDDAQDKVLKPLTGLGTDMSVTRPLKTASGSGTGAQFRVGPGGPGGGPGGPGGLSPNEQEELQKENGGARFGLRNLGKPGEKFENTNFVSTSQLSFPESQAGQVGRIDGVKDVAAALTLSAITIKGTVPKETPGAGGTFGAPAPGPTRVGPRAVNFQPTTVSGVDVTNPSLALVTPGQVQSGRWFNGGTATGEAILSTSFAQREGYKLGDRYKLGKKAFTVVGLSKPPLGGQASDAYVELGVLQKLSSRKGRVNVLQVRASGAGKVGSIASEIKSSFTGAQVTTAKDLGKRIGGSLSHARDLSGKLGTALAIVALAAAFLIASLLTLSSVNKRTRELGTLKALGWPQRLVVRQVTGESLAQGVLGGLLGALAGIGGAALIGAVGPTLDATVAAPAQAGPFGQGAVQAGTSTVTLDAPVSITLILLAIGLALAGGLVSGAVGGLRAARLRPADALRNIE